MRGARSADSPAGRKNTASAPAQRRAMALPVSVKVEKITFRFADLALSAAISVPAARTSPTDAAWIQMGRAPSSFRNLLLAYQPNRSAKPGRKRGRNASHSGKKGNAAANATESKILYMR